jgi:hypothetical protein
MGVISVAAIYKRITDFLVIRYKLINRQKVIRFLYVIILQERYRIHGVNFSLEYQ